MTGGEAGILRQSVQDVGSDDGGRGRSSAWSRDQQKAVKARRWGLLRVDRVAIGNDQSSTKHSREDLSLSFGRLITRELNQVGRGADHLRVSVAILGVILHPQVQERLVLVGDVQQHACPNIAEELVAMDQHIPRHLGQNDRAGEGRGALLAKAVHDFIMADARGLKKGGAGGSDSGFGSAFTAQ